MLLLPAPSWFKSTKERVRIDPDATSQKESEAFKNTAQALKNQSLAQDIQERKKFAKRSFVITCVWIGFLIVETLIQQALSIWKFGLSEKEFITVVTTTTASIFGFWMLVGRYLFHKP